MLLTADSENRDRDESRQRGDGEHLPQLVRRIAALLHDRRGASGAGYELTRKSHLRSGRRAGVRGAGRRMASRTLARSSLSAGSLAGHPWSGPECWWRDDTQDSSVQRNHIMRHITRQPSPVDYWLAVGC